MKKETLEEAAEIDLTNLCYYDKRNPDCSTDDEEIEDHKKSLLKKNKTCSCDNCFYGRTELTNQLIRQAEKSYSEEDMRKAFIAGGNSQIEEDDDYGTEYDAYMEKWFEQFKKEDKQ